MQLGHLKSLLLGHMAQNVDKNQLFEFLRMASLDNQNAEAQREAYWMIVYIYLMKHVGVDISESLPMKTRHMLRDVDLSQLEFN